MMDFEDDVFQDTMGLGYGGGWVTGPILLVHGDSSVTDIGLPVDR